MTFNDWEPTQTNRGGHQLFSTVQAIWRITCCWQLQKFFLRSSSTCYLSLSLYCPYHKTIPVNYFTNAPTNTLTQVRTVVKHLPPSFPARTESSPGRQRRRRRRTPVSPCSPPRHAVSLPAPILNARLITTRVRFWVGFSFSLNYNHKLMLLTVCNKVLMKYEGVNTHTHNFTIYSIHLCVYIQYIYTYIHTGVYIYI